MNNDSSSKNDEWTIVKTKKKVQQSNNHNNHNKNNKNNKKTIKSNRIIDDNDDDNDINTYDNIMKVINATTIELKRSRYYINLLESIRSSITSKNIESDDYALKEIVSLGIGAFSKSPSALLQLVMTLCLAQEFLRNTNTDNSDEEQSIKYNCIIFDPIFNDTEVLVCNKLGLNVSKENKYGKHMTTNDDDKYGLTMFFMPHCPYRLYCNLLWKNWSNLANIIIYGNSFSSYGLRRMNNSSSKDTDLTDCIVCMESFIVEKTLSLDISRNNVPKELLHFENAFNDLSLHYFTNESLSSKQAIDLLNSSERPTEEQIDDASAQDEELF